MAATAESTGVEVPIARVPPLTLAGLLLTLALASLDQNIVSTALPRIVSELGGLEHLSWVVTAFMVASTATTPLYGKLSDLFGRRRLFMISITIFLAGSMLCGLSASMGQLILFRFLQGLGAGGLISLAQIAVGDLVPARERGRYQGIFAAVFAVCSVAGPLLGGFLTDVLSWRWIFYINIPVGGGALFLLMHGLPKTAKQVRRRIDYLGAGLMAAATVSVLLVLSWGGNAYPWSSPIILGLAAVAVNLITFLVVVELQAHEPMLALPLFANRVYVIAVAVTGMTATALFGSVVFLPAFFQIVLGASPSTSGLMATPLMGGLIVTSTLGGRFVSKTGHYKIVAVTGLAVALAGFLGVAWTTGHSTSRLPIEITLACLGAGFGMTMPNLTVAIQNSVDHRRLGVATATSAFFRSLGGALGVAVAGAINTSHLHGLLGDNGAAAGGEGGTASLQQIVNQSPEAHAAIAAAYRDSIGTTLLTGAAIVAVAFCISWFLPERPLGTASPTDPKTPRDPPPEAGMAIAD